MSEAVKLHRKLGVTIALVILIVDQLIKFFVTHTLQLPSWGNAGIERRLTQSCCAEHSPCQRCPAR